jgi:hypothetical protein
MYPTPRLRRSDNHPSGRGTEAGVKTPLTVFQREVAKLIEPGERREILDLIESGKINALERAELAQRL